MERFSLSCPREVTFLLTCLEDAGHEAYVVGGCVRDALLGIQPHDWDITTSASPDEVKAALNLTRPGVKRWMAKLSPEQLRRLLKVKACLLAARTEAKESERAALTRFGELVQQLRQEGAACVMEDLAVHGKDLIAAGFAPGRRMGAILNALLEEVIEEQTPNEPDALLHRALELEYKEEIE